MYFIVHSALVPFHAFQAIIILLLMPRNFDDHCTTKGDAFGNNEELDQVTFYFKEWVGWSSNFFLIFFRRKLNLDSLFPFQSCMINGL